MNLVHRSAVCLALLAPLAAQGPATTLLAGCQRAAVVVRATVLAATDPSPEWHRLSLRSDEVLKGTVGATFELLEPAGACCGRSLFALQPGQHCLLFLQRTGAVLHPFGGSRGVLADEPDLVQAVRDLLGAATDAARAQRLVGQLQHGDPRVAADAAQALATLPTLALAGNDRDALGAALLTALQRRATTAAPLLDAVVRLQDPALLDQLLPAYLATERDDQARLLRRGLCRVSLPMLTERLPMFVGGDDGRQLRAAELLADLPAAETMPALQNLVQTTGCPRVKLCASEALLAGGASAASLAPFVPEAILELAQRRGRTPRTFRSIRPGQP
ncbi:MAG: hypothetical protein JNM25_00020 [Planctomycetes bacterium]|nr:hypothetical protein [Planctomycetota bacterium]